VSELRFLHFEPRFWSSIWIRNSEKISDVSFSSIYKWCKFRNFSSKLSQMKKWERNNKNYQLEDWTNHIPEVNWKTCRRRVVLCVSSYQNVPVSLLRQTLFFLNTSVIILLFGLESVSVAFPFTHSHRYTPNLKEAQHNANWQAVESEYIVLRSNPE